jgi:hypothetical protein
MLGNILGSFISMLVGGNIMYYAWSMSLWQRLGMNTIGLLGIYIGLAVLYNSLNDIGIFSS